MARTLTQTDRLALLDVRKFTYRELIEMERAGIIEEDQQFPETHKNQHSSGIPTCLFVNCHAKMGLS